MQRLDELHCFYAGSRGRACGALWLHCGRSVAGPGIALSYTEAIFSYCESLRTFPYRGHRRDDIRPGFRITNYKKRTVIAFAVESELVAIIGVFYGGQDYEQSGAMTLTVSQASRIDTSAVTPPFFSQPSTR